MPCGLAVPILLGPENWDKPKRYLAAVERAMGSTARFRLERMCWIPNKVVQKAGELVRLIRRRIDRERELMQS